MDNSEENTSLKIFFPSLRFDMDTPLEVANFWENEEVEIYTVVDFDSDYRKEDFEPIGMPMCLDKVQIYIKKQLKEFYEVYEFEEPSEDDECWVLKWKYKERLFTLYYYFGFDPLGEYWPETIGEIDSFIHTNEPINLEEGSDMVALLQERCPNADVYASKEMADLFWPDADEYYEFADDSDIDEYDDDSLYYLGEIKPYLP